MCHGLKRGGFGMRTAILGWGQYILLMVYKLYLYNLVYLHVVLGQNAVKIGVSYG